MTRYIVAALCAFATSGVTFAQEEKQPPRGQGRGQFGRLGAIGASYLVDLNMKEVQEDLKLSDDDKKKLGELKTELTEGDKKFGESLQGVAREEMGEKMNARRAEVVKQVKDVLGDKYTRFHQIRLQLDGAFASVTRNREVAEKLEISDDQRNELQEAGRGAFQRPEPGAEPPSREKMQEMIAEQQKKQAEAVEKVLTADQKKKWEELIGAKVTYKRPPQQFGGGGRRGNAERKEGDAKPPQ